jgi:hypothetical protein
MRFEKYTFLVRKPEDKGLHGSCEEIWITLQLISWFENIVLIHLVQDRVRSWTLV